MYEKNLSPSLITLTEWTAICEEIRQNANDKIDLFNNIVPIPQQQETNQDNSYIKFKSDDISSLLKIFSQLKEKLDQLPQFLSLCQGIMPNILNVPNELLVTMFKNINARDFSSLLSSCRFFHYNRPLQTQFKLRFHYFAGYQHTLLLTPQGTLKGCGINSSGQLGLGNYDNQRSLVDISIKALEVDETINKLFSGRNTTILLTTKNRLLQCGVNKFVKYQGIAIFEEFKVSSLLPDEIIEDVCVSSHILILTNQHRLLGYGENSNGQLGLGHHSNINAFNEIPRSFLKPDEIIQKLASGALTSFLLTSEGRLFGAGYNPYGGLGLGYKSWSVETFSEITIPTLLEDEKVTDIQSSEGSVIVLTNKGRLFSCGSNSDGELCLGDTKERKSFTEISLTGLTEQEHIKQLYVSQGSHNFVMTNTGRLFGWGCNHQGQLGLGNAERKTCLTEIPLNFLEENEFIHELVLGGCHSIIQTTKGRVLGCGRHYYGQLGQIEPELTQNGTYTFTPCFSKVPDEELRLNSAFKV